MTTITTKRQGERGFTLVELAIVMIIIGLLIGGILKGQELIANARIASAATKVKAIDAALNTFRDSYGSLPGDLAAPNTRLPGCTNRCNNAGNGNNQIGGAPDAANAAASENTVAWAQLAVADLLGGIRDTAATEVVTGGTTHPNAEVPGQFYIGYAAGLAGLGLETTTLATRAGHYLAVYNGAGAVAQAVAAAGVLSLTPNQANRIDQKIDDGQPNTGSTLAMGVSGTCTVGADGTAANNVYQGATADTVCGLYIRVQQ